VGDLEWGLELELRLRFARDIVRVLVGICLRVVLRFIGYWSCVKLGRGWMVGFREVVCMGRCLWMTTLIRKSLCLLA